jgi:hypothetical protein
VTSTTRSDSIFRTLWLDLGWLVVLVMTFATTLTLDAFGALNYFWSLLLWAIPLAYLMPLFLTLTRDGSGRRRRALLLSAGLITTLGVVLDFLLGDLTLVFPGCDIPGKYLYCNQRRDSRRGVAVLRRRSRRDSARLRLRRRTLARRL